MEASDRAVADMSKEAGPVLTDIAPVEGILALKYRPALSGNSCHLMTDQEVREGLCELASLNEAGIKGATVRIERFQRELLDRQSETFAEKTWRMRERLAWELALDKKLDASKEFPHRFPPRVTPYAGSGSSRAKISVGGQ